MDLEIEEDVDSLISTLYKSHIQRFYKVDCNS